MAKRQGQPVEPLGRLALSFRDAVGHRVPHGVCQAEHGRIQTAQPTPVTWRRKSSCSLTQQSWSSLWHTPSLHRLWDGANTVCCQNSSGDRRPTAGRSAQAQSPNGRSGGNRSPAPTCRTRHSVPCRSGKVRCTRRSGAIRSHISCRARAWSRPCTCLPPGPPPLPPSTQSCAAAQTLLLWRAAIDESTG